ncbi:MAG: hypothetical protein KDJ44_18090 [Rhodoblastus sp.]|nr:hypothetical protein [Rhodoblastus sp.]
MLAPFIPRAVKHHSGFMADSRGAMRAKLEALAAPALLAAIFLLMTAFVLVRSRG